MRPECVLDIAFQQVGMQISVEIDFYNEWAGEIAGIWRRLFRSSAPKELPT